MTTNEPPLDDDRSPSSGAPNPKAQWSMILGIVSLVLCGFCGVPAVVGVVAVVLGVLGRREVTASDGRQTGGGMALTGIATGAVAALGGLLILSLVASGTLDGATVSSID